MPTLTIEYHDEDERVALEQAIAYFADLRRLALEAPEGTVLDACEGLALDKGRSLIEVSYEDTVANIEATARRFLTACQLDWEPACVEFHLTKRPVRTASLTQVRKPVHTRSVERWRNYERAMNDVFSLLPGD